MRIHLVHVDAADRFLDRLAGVTDPEEKRKIVGETFIRVFEEEADKLGAVDFIAQGTTYPDVIESAATTPPPTSSSRRVGAGQRELQAAVTIKTHHNVGGLPEGDDVRARRAAALPVQGRGAQGRPRARPAGGDGVPPAVPRARAWRSASSAR